jgi:hypothetical protein
MLISLLLLLGNPFSLHVVGSSLTAKAYPLQVSGDQDKKLGDALLTTTRQLQEFGQGQNTLIQTLGNEPASSDNTLRYYCTFRSLWTKGRMPISFPEETAQFNGPVLFSHSPLFQGIPQKPALESLAEVSHACSSKD